MPTVPTAPTLQTLLCPAFSVPSVNSLNSGVHLCSPHPTAEIRPDRSIRGTDADGYDSRDSPSCCDSGSTGTVLREVGHVEGAAADQSGELRFRPAKPGRETLPAGEGLCAMERESAAGVFETLP